MISLIVSGSVFGGPLSYGAVKILDYLRGIPSSGDDSNVQPAEQGIASKEYGNAYRNNPVESSPQGLAASISLPAETPAGHSVQSREQGIASKEYGNAYRNNPVESSRQRLAASISLPEDAPREGFTPYTFPKQNTALAVVESRPSGQSRAKQPEVETVPKVAAEGHKSTTAVGFVKEKETRQPVSKAKSSKAQYLALFGQEVKTVADEHGSRTAEQSKTDSLEPLPDHQTGVAEAAPSQKEQKAGQEVFVDTATEEGTEEPEELDATIESNFMQEEAGVQKGEDETDVAHNASKALDAVPVLDASTRGALTASQDISLASGQLSMNGLSGLRNMMRLYRTGRMFEYGQVSLDGLTAEEMLVSVDRPGSVPVRDLRSDGWHSFAQAYGQLGRYRGLQSLADASYQGFGLNTGLFSQVDDELTIGLMFGVQKVSLDRTGGLGASLESVRFGPFLSWVRNDWHVDAALVVAQNRYELNRRDSQGNQLKADFDGMELNGYLAVGYDLHLDHWMQGLTVTPMAEFFYSHVNHGGFREKGESSQALKVESQSNDQLITRLGVEVDYIFQDLEHPTELNFKLGWQQHSQNSGSTLYELPGQAASGRFSANGFSDSGIFYGASLRRKLSDSSNLSLSYSATSTGKGLSHGLQLSYEWKF
ncbi:MAG: autotransporter outer membrane beta-barrel domain-containing protein [Endozoicomonas sp.]